MNSGLLPDFLHHFNENFSFSLVGLGFLASVSNLHHAIYEITRSGDKKNASRMELCINWSVLEISSHSVIYFFQSKIIIFV